MTTQLFNAAGITTLDNITKVRYSNDIVRHVKKFSKAGAERIDFVDLPQEMTKIDALKFMLTHPDFQSEDDQATIVETLEEKVKKATHVPIPRKKKLPTLDSIASRNRKDTTVTDILSVIN